MGVIAVTGSASGIGAAVKTQLQEHGHSVIGVDCRDADVVADLSTTEGRRSAIDAIGERCGGRLDGLVCCAGLGPTAPSSGLIVAVNYFGVSELLDGLAQVLEKGTRPAVTVVGSVASVHQDVDKLPMVQMMLAGQASQAQKQADELGMPHAAYAASKYAITVFARGLASDWGARGIRMNVIAPGAVETPLLEASKADPRFGEAIRNFVSPLGRNGRAEEIANVICFVQSDLASFMHGAVVFADGGMDAMSRAARF